MKNSPFKILLIASSHEDNRLLEKLLSENGYIVESAEKIDFVIEKIMSHSTDLVICKNKMNDFNGFEIFKILKKYLSNCGIPFFLELNSFEKDDMIIGLELGIDNFIFTPINKISLFCKIENQLKKREELNIFATNHFSEFFNSSAIAMFFVSANKVTKVNQAFHKIHNGFTSEMLNLPVDSIFNVKGSKQNELSFRRFQNGITNDCLLTNVYCNFNLELNFDINFFRGDNLNSEIYFAELLPKLVPEQITGNIAGNQSMKQGINEKVYDFDADIQQYHIKLTKRETQIFELSAKGLPIKLIADQLNLSERTVEKHRANIMAKANAKNMIEAILKMKTL